jgi:hypothetical protein
LPPEHVSVLVQAMPQPPQLARSVPRLVHPVGQQVSPALQETPEPGHWHLPAEHCSSETQVMPQLPQLLRSLVGSMQPPLMPAQQILPLEQAPLLPQ